MFAENLEALTDSASFEIEFAAGMVNEYRKVITPRLEATAIPILSVASPWERGAYPTRDSKGPRYPPAAKSAGVGASIVMQFLVDSAGNVVASSMRDVWPKDRPRLTGEMETHYLSFVDAVRAALIQMKFEPAVIGGCKTAQLLQMPFTFTLSR